MGKRKLPTKREKIYTIRMKKVPIELDLWAVVEALLGKLKSLIEIYRVYDHRNYSRCNEVFAIIRSSLEYAALKEMKTIFIAWYEIELEFHDYFAGTLLRPSNVITAAQDEIEGSSIGLKIDGLTEVSTVTSIYLRDLLHAFESKEKHAVVTGFNFVYDDRKDRIRPFGYVYFNDREVMLKYHKNLLRVDEKFYKCEASTRTPVILSEQNKSLIATLPATYSSQIGAANMLCGYSMIGNGSDLDISNQVNSMNLEVSSPTKDANETDPEDNGSVISLDLDYEFDDELNIIPKSIP